jgi:hypothetical protein
MLQWHIPRPNYKLGLKACFSVLCFAFPNRVLLTFTPLPHQFPAFFLIGSKRTTCKFNGFVAAGCQLRCNHIRKKLLRTRGVPEKYLKTVVHPCRGILTDFHHKHGLLVKCFFYSCIIELPDVGLVKCGSTTGFNKSDESIHSSR